MELRGHQQLRALQHALGDPERDPVDEEALPELEGRGRRLAETREVHEVAAESAPSAQPPPAPSAAPPPERTLNSAAPITTALRNALTEADQHDGAPGRRDRSIHGSQ